jgi:hypothetical protein
MPLSTHGTGTYTIKGWEQRQIADFSDGVTMIHASPIELFQGVIEGEGHVEYLMTSPNNGVTTYVGLMRIDGQVEGRAGTFLVQISGTFAAGVPTESWTIIPDSGTGDLQGIQGTGGIASSDQAPAPANPADEVAYYTFDYTLPAAQ